MAWTFQRRRCCTFDSPGLPNDSEGYPGLVYVVRGTTPSVLCFFWLIRHERFHCKRAFIEKAQHLRRWIPLRTFTRGRLVPRQPRAIKRTTRTELPHEDIYIAKFIHWDNSAIPTQLRDETIVSVAWLIIKGEIVKGKQSPTPSPLLSSFRRLHEQRPMVPRRGRGVISRGNGGSCLKVNRRWWCCW